MLPERSLITPPLSLSLLPLRSPSFQHTLSCSQHASQPSWNEYICVPIRESHERRMSKREKNLLHLPFFPLVAVVLLSIFVFHVLFGRCRLVRMLQLFSVALQHVWVCARASIFSALFFLAYSVQFESCTHIFVLCSISFSLLFSSSSIILCIGKCDGDDTHTRARIRTIMWNICMSTRQPFDETGSTSLVCECQMKNLCSFFPCERVCVWHRVPSTATLRMIREHKDYMGTTTTSAATLRHTYMHVAVLL